MPTRAPPSIAFTPADPPRFREVQTSPRMWILGTVLVALFVLPQAWIAWHRFPGPGSTLSVLQLLFYGVLALASFRGRLLTEVRGDALRLRYVFHAMHVVPLSAIRSVDVVSYYPGIDGGFGNRRGRGLRIWLRSGDFLLLGTRRPEELRGLLQPREAVHAGPELAPLSHVGGSP